MRQHGLRLGLWHVGHRELVDPVGVPRRRAGHDLLPRFREELVPDELRRPVRGPNRALHRPCATPLAPHPCSRALGAAQPPLHAARVGGRRHPVRPLLWGRLRGANSLRLRHHVGPPASPPPRPRPSPRRHPPLHSACHPICAGSASSSRSRSSRCSPRWTGASSGRG